VSGTLSTDVDAAPPTLADDGLLRLIADAYRAAALEGANMRRATDALEAIRSSGSPDAYFDVWDAIDQQIGLADEAALQRTLIGLRGRFADAVVAYELTRRRRALEADAEAGWRDWLRTFAETLDQWRWALLNALAETELPFPANAASEVESIRRWTWLAARDRWPEADPLLRYLGSLEFLPPALQGAMHVYSAQVQLYHYFLPEQALPLVEQAEAVAPDAPTVVLGRAEYQLQRGDYEAARERCEPLTASHPTEVGAHNLIGQTFDRENDLESAEHWYSEAVRLDPGDSTGYLNLLRLYGRPELLGTHEPRLTGLLDRAIAVDPYGEYNGYVAMGLLYQQNGRYPEAHSWYDRAIALAGDRDDAHVQQANAFLDQSLVADAEAAFSKAIERAPGAFDGYWGLAGVYETEGRWAEALEYFRESLARRADWRSSILARTGSILVTLERYEEAEAELLEALRLDPQGDAPTSSLERLVAACYEDPGRTDASLRILNAMLDVKGAEYEHTYRNLVGNIKYFFERYDEAIPEYERASELDPDEPVYHANLAIAWEHRRLPGARTEELANAIDSQRRALELAPDEAEYREKLAALRAEQTVVGLAGERALDLPWPPPLRVDVSAPLLPGILDEQGDISDEILGLIEEMRTRINASTGILVPGIRFRELESVEAAYVIAIRGTLLPTEHVEIDKYFCEPPLARLTQLGIPAEVHRQSRVGAWVDPEHHDAAVAAGIELWPSVRYLLAHLESVLRSQLDQFVDHRQAAQLLEGVESGSEITGSPSLLTEFVAALRALVRERVPVVALDEICAEFLARADERLSQLELLARLRALPGVASRLPGNDPSVELRPLHPAVESELEAAVVDGGAQPVIALSHRDYPKGIEALQARPRDGERIAHVVSNPKLRPFVWALVEPIPDVCVISQDELAPARRAELEGEVAAT
jgi:tetratricopeptide (TPR) repeat protein